METTKIGMHVAYLKKYHYQPLIIIMIINQSSLTSREVSNTKKPLSRTPPPYSSSPLEMESQNGMDCMWRFFVHRKTHFFRIQK